ncbi:MAG: hypothetical protein QOF52_600, partial [Propionibacteriaceae bacterium]|nr:hypothetical protein [Propionibacteriaceae bacterium]
AIRAEYAHVPADEFAEARLNVLMPLLETDIFRTTKGRRLTAAAHANLTEECESLADQLGIDLEGFRS